MTETTSQRIRLTVGDQTQMHAYVARPSGAAANSGIIVVQEAFGVNTHIRDVADRCAQLGMVAVAPELFHRTADGFEGSYGDFDAIRPHMAALTVPGIIADMRAAYQWLREEAGLAPERIAVIGFCMGGRVAYLANAELPFGAAISFYGGGIAPEHLERARTQHGPLLMFWGGKDAHIPAEQYRAVADALTAADALHEQVVFSQADHGFFCDQRASYDPGSARQAWALVLEFLRVFGVL